MSTTQKRLPKEVFDEIFRLILSIAAHKGLLRGGAIGIDSTTIQANVSLRWIVRKDSGKGRKDYTTTLARKADLDDPTDGELRQLDRNSKGKKVSNDDWANPHDPDATITRMKDGTTRIAYKVKHAVDRENAIVVSTTVHPGTAPDRATIINTAIDAAANAEQAGADNKIEAIVADKGYHSTNVLTLAAELRMRAYIPERASSKQPRWANRDPKEKRAAYSTRRRTNSERGKQICRLRSEPTARAFATVSDTGGPRQRWLRRLMRATIRLLMMVWARNL